MKTSTRQVLAPMAALAFAFGAQAFTPQFEGFEGYAAGDPITSGANNFRYVAGEGSTDASVVTAYGEDPKPSADSGDNYLKLSTDDGLLFRDINADSSSATLGAAGADIEASMQFTITDASDRPTVTAGDKLALWLETDGVTTNLMAHGGLYVDNNGTLELTGTTIYSLTGVTVVPGTWYNVKLQALKNINTPENPIPGFQVLIDGTPLNVTVAEGVSALMLTTYVPSMSASATLASVGFSGSGRVDNLAITDNATAGVMLELVDGVQSTDDGGVYTFTAPEGYTIGSIATNGVVIAIAPGQTAVNFEPAAGTTSLIVSATKTRPAPAHKWFELPSAIASTRLYDAQAKVSGFKGSRDDEFYTFNYKTSNGGYKLYDYDSLRSGDATPVSELTAATAKAEIPGYAASDATRGAAVCKALNVNLVMSYKPGDKMLAIPLTSTNAVADASVIENDRGYAFDSGTFSPDGQYLFTNVLPDKDSGVTNTMVVKWHVLNGLKGNGTNLLYVSQLNVGEENGSRIRHAEYVRIGGKDLVYCLVDDVNDGSEAKDAGIKVANMTDGTVTTICALTGKASYGMFAISGVASGTPHLTFGPSQNNGYDASTNPWAGEGQKILVYTLAADGLSVVGDPLEFTLPDMGIPSQAGYGNTLLVSDDEKTMFYVCSDGLIYAVEYAVARVEGGFGYETLKEAVEAASEGDTVKVLADCTVDQPITFTAGINLTNDYTVSLAAAYALRFANGTTTPVTVSGTGTITWSSGSGSPFLVGNNEQENSTKMGFGITNTCSGSLVLNSGTFGSTTGSGNMVKVENGSFTMNGGSIDAACTRCVKADADAGAFTATVTINGGTIRNSKASAPVALCSSAESADGTANVTVNGGDITGTLVYGKTTGTYSLTIPSSSTARFDRDQTEFCATGYATSLNDGWYTVGAVVYSITYYDAEGASFKNWAEAYEPTTGYTIVDNVTLPGADNIDLGGVMGVAFGGWTNATGTVVTNWVAGEMTEDLALYLKLDPIVPTGYEPGAVIGNDYASAEAATNAANAATVVVPGAIAAELDAEQQTAYVARFAGKVIDNGDGTFTVTMALKDTEEAALQEQANGDAASMVPSIATARGVSIAATPGFYYSLKAGTQLGSMSEGERVLATGDTVSLDLVRPQGSTANFYQVMINIMPKVEAGE